MANLTEEFNPQNVVKLLCFPHSMDFHKYFEAFRNTTIWSTRDSALNAQIYEFISAIDNTIKDRIQSLNLPVSTNIDWRSMNERTSDGFSIETMQPIIKISGAPKDLGRIFLNPCLNLTANLHLRKDMRTL